MLYIQDQFTFIHDAILESVTCGDTQIAATNLRMKLVKMKRNDNKNESHGFQYQFKVYLNIRALWYAWGLHTCLYMLVHVPPDFGASFS